MPSLQPKLRRLHQIASTRLPTNVFHAIGTSRRALLALRDVLPTHPSHRHETTQRRALTRTPLQRRSLFGRRGCRQHRRSPSDKKLAADVCRQPIPSAQFHQSVGLNRGRKPTIVFVRYQAATAGGHLPGEQCAREKMALQAHRKATPQKWCCA